ncbi:MAG: hypothetical protein ABIS50_01495 [Luteolibacter sp.]|uniref:hypothetical protein n=1 Tax=Luteolibacter sp. TaxID=1962973 RepID=UPI003266C536
MKSLIAALFFVTCGSAAADEYRYHLSVTTGLQECVFDQRGKQTTIVFSKDSDSEARFILEKILELGGINGTKGMDEWHGAPFDQALILKGRLEPKIRRTASAPNSAQSEDYQEFKLEEVMVRFPLVRHRPGKVFDTAFLETHFSFDTLFPEGLVFKGTKVNFDKHTASGACAHR